VRGSSTSVQGLPGERNLVFGEARFSKKPGFNGIAKPGEIRSVLGSMQIKVVEEKRVTLVENRHYWLTVAHSIIYLASLTDHSN